jgi:signal transduction histidine kinase
VQRFAPKLIGSLDRAIRLCTDTLRFGRADEEPPQRQQFDLRPLVEEVGEGLGLPVSQRLQLIIDVPGDIVIDADPDQMFRVLTNLIRNAAQVLEAAAPGAGQVTGQVTGEGAGEGAAAVPRLGEITVSAKRVGSTTEIAVTDTGPGIPDRARKHLFAAFQGSVRKGGTGLGLAICSEIVRAHGGTIALAKSGPEGTAFQLAIPDRVASS